ncbi:hypothetical protein CLV98_102121 [Dyadobacter jejuensis]|uniref:Subunit length determinant protein n=1 Tax=Dyadobacter jejuensis TaxID=1082580 RepID=A0A316APV2_9BACT|nr:hypothetical protein [Dyadobacter jejuensis]PWJ59289.1 hypothetical protein CLV98_102121 [Dyadobacter jejuensis]
MSQNTPSIPDDQLTPKDVIEKLVLVKDAIIRNWKFLILFPLIGLGIGFVLDKVLKNPTQYEAVVVFNLGAGGQNNGLGDVAGLLGLGSAPDANIFTGENFFYFVKSRPVLERNLMKEVEVDGKKMLLANYFILKSGIKDKEWKDRPDMENFQFKESDPAKMTLDDHVVLNEIVTKAANSTEIGTLDRKSSFIALATSMEDELLAGLWVTNLLDTVEEMYTENQTQKTRKTRDLLKRRADSLATVLGITEHKLAKQMDNSQQLIFAAPKLQTSSTERKSAFLQQLYYEALGSVEKMNVSLVRESPLFTKIEDIKVPLDMKYEDSKRAKIGALAGFLLSLIFIYFKTVFSTVPQKEQS